MEEEIKQLNELLNHCRDAEKGYRTAAAQADHSALQAVLESQRQQRQDFVYELEQHIRILGGEPVGQTHLGAGAHRIWINLKGLVTGGQSSAIVEECLRGENEMVKYYERIMNATTFSNDTRLLLASQLQKIKHIREELNKMLG